MGKLVEAFDEAARKKREEQSYQVTEKAGSKGFYNFSIGEILNAKSLSEELDETLNLCLKELQLAEVNGLLIKCESKEERDKKAIDISNEKINFEIPPKKESNKPSRRNLTVEVEYVNHVKEFYQQQPFFYDIAGMFWFWGIDEFKYKLIDDVGIMVLLDKVLGLEGQTITGKVKSNYLEAFKRVGRINLPNQPKKEWLQFKDQIFNIITSEVKRANAKYFFTNPIPYEIGDSIHTPVMDELFTQWVGKDNVRSLYEIIAYCCYRDYPIHLLFCFVGSGRNGKSTFLKLINKFIGMDNVCSTELDTLLNSRFESFKLYKKLVCTLGETNFGVLSKTSMLKKLVGQDLIGYEYKQKKPFDDYNYAKIIISSNSLPTSTDTSEGFYRRWFIMDFPNTFPEGKDILETIPEEEYNNLARKITIILPKLLNKGLFTNQGTIEERKEKYILSSNPLSHFLKSNCYKDTNLFCFYSELYLAYRSYLNENKKRPVSYKEFSNALIEEGLEVQRTSKKVDEEYISGRFVMGIKLKERVEL